MAGSDRLRRSVYLLLAVFLCAFTSARDANAAVRDQDPEADPPMNQSHALVFDKTEINVGELSEDDMPEIYRFTFTNTGDKPLVVTKVTSSCGCAVASFSREPVKTGQEAVVSVKFSPKGHPGNLSRNVFVYTNASSAHPSAKLTLRGFVHPTKDKWQGYRVVMGPSLRAKSDRVVFRAMPRQGVRVERIECVNTGTVPLRLSASRGSLPPHLSFRTEPEVIAPGETADLVVAVDAGKLPPQCDGKEQWTILIEGIGGKPEQRSLRIEADFIN